MVKLYKKFRFGDGFLCLIYVGNLGSQDTCQNDPICVYINKEKCYAENVQKTCPMLCGKCSTNGQ